MVRLVRGLFSAAFITFVSIVGGISPLHAQVSTATNTVIAIGPSTQGIVQAGDGNFYAPSLKFFQSCQNNSSQNCAFIYQITPSGTMTPFHAFQPVSNTASPPVNTDGIVPQALIVGTDGNLYGACNAGGPGGFGTIFQITLTGTFKVLKSFGITGNVVDPGNQPNSLIQAPDGSFYFTNGVGVYRLTTAGVVNTIYTFTPDPKTLAFPKGAGATSLMQASDGDLYLTLSTGPQAKQGDGTTGSIAQLNPSTGVLTTVHALAADGSEGIGPDGPLVQDINGDLFGVTRNLATVSLKAFKVAPDGTYTVLHSFTGSADGGHTQSALILGSDGNLYGVAHAGGDVANANCGGVGCGTVFQLAPIGALTTLYTFEGGTPTSSVVADNPQVDGGFPWAPLVQTTDGSFYGTSLGVVIFKTKVTPTLPPPVQLTLSPTTAATNTDVTLKWKVLNAYSTTAQQCGASVVGNPPGAGTWSGPHIGSFSNSVWSGSDVITPTRPGTYTYALVCGGNEAGFATLKVVTGYQITTLVLPQGEANKKYVSALETTGGAGADTWSATNVPPGLELDPATGAVTGVPSQFGDYSMSVTATDSASPPHQDIETVALKIISGLKIQTTTLQKATVEAKYAQTLVAIGGWSPLLINGKTVYTWSITSGNLPDGLSMDSNGKISGTPTATGNFPITVQVKDGESTPATDTVSLTLKVVPTVQIAAVEFTQVIQQYETLDDLNTSLTNNNEPPVPILSGKPGVMRVYFTKLKDATDVVLKVTGAINMQKAMNLPPDCDPSDARIHLSHCPSMDFYFTPPSGSWSASLSLEDDTNTELETETFAITSRDTLPLNIKGVSVCTVPHQDSSCTDPSVLLSLTGVMSTLLPTSSVPPPTILPTKVLHDPTLQPDLDTWVLNGSEEIDKLYAPADAAADASAGQRTDYVGVYDHNILETGVGEIGKHGIFLPNSTTRMGVLNTPFTLAHEFGHTLNLLHTNLSTPLAAGSPKTPPGCWNIAADDSTYWPYSDNRVQSSTGAEYGFDVPNGSVVHPNAGAFGQENNAYELMGYCVSRWISPLNYKRALLYVNGGAAPAPSVRNGVRMAQERGVKSFAKAAAVTYTQGSYLQVSGSLPTTGIQLHPIFTANVVGTSDPGSGTYSIEELNSSGQVLFTRNFTPSVDATEIVGTDFVSAPHFSQFIPATTGAASIAVLDSTGSMLKTVAITGAPPVVNFTVPAAGFVGSGLQTVTWTASSSTATSFTSRIFYSADSGTTWQLIEETPDLSLEVNFNTVAGSPSGMLRVDVSDGINTGSAASVAFNVPKKKPSAIVINTPIDGAIRQAADPIYLSGAAFDADDGVLTGKALQWSSDAQGDLGTGSPLSVNLTPGTHTITLTATDSDGNSLTATTHITLGGAAPVVTLTANNASGCTTATINAIPGNMGANLTAVTYSFDGGATYTAVPLTTLPFNVPVTGAGTVSVVALAVDGSGQVSSKSTNVTAGASCSATTLKANAGNGQSNLVGSTFPTALTTQVVDGAGNPVAGVTVNYAAPTNGASATLSAASVVTNASGLATVTATANSVGGSYSVTASMANSTSTATFALSNSDFKIAPASSTLTVSKGSNGTDVITLSALGGFNGTVNFTCSGLPSGTTCAFSPAQLTPTTTTATTTMTITASQTAALHWPAGGMSMLACAALMFLPRRRKHFLGLVILSSMIAVSTLTGCGGGATPTQKGTSATITVTASSGTLQRTTAVTVHIQ